MSGFKLFLFIISFLMMVACDSTGGEPVSLPSVGVNCTTAKCGAVATASYPAVITITLSGCPKDQIDNELIAVSSINVSCTNGVGCTGGASSWSDESSLPIFEVVSRGYYVCGWIDLDNDTKDSDDAFSDEFLFIDGNNFTITSWSAPFRVFYETTKNRQ